MKRVSRTQRCSAYGEMALSIAGNPDWRHGLLALLCAMLLGLPEHAAAEPIEISAEEFALLPKYCRYTQPYVKNYSSDPNSRHWRELLGPDFDHLHHYCWGLAKVIRIDRAANTLKWNQAQRDFKLNDAAGEFVYVVRNSSTLPILPEVLMKYGTVLGRVRRDKEAIAAFEAAIEKKQDYVPAYLKLSELLFERGNAAEAKKVAEEGLKYAPDSKSLRLLLADIEKRGTRGSPDKSDPTKNKVRGN